MSIRETVLQGRLPEGLRVFDAHAHLGPNETYTNTALLPMPLQECLAFSRSIGISAVAGIPMGALGAAPAAGNEWMIQTSEAHPGEVYTYLYYNPRYHNEIMAQVEKYRGHPGFFGIKIHPREDHASLEGRDYEALFEAVGDGSVIILCHTWDTEPMNRPSAFTRHLEKHPKLKILMGHMGGTYGGCMDTLHLARSYENVYCDINGSLYSQLWLEELVKLAPLEKFIFSTDQTFNDPRIIAGRVLLSELSDAAKEKILCGNIEAAVGKRLVV